MIFVFFAALIAALSWACWRLWKQNRLLAELREAVRAGRPLLRGESAGLPQWASLTSAVNELLAVSATLRQRQSDQLAQLEATLGNLREAVMVVDEANYVHLANRAVRDIFPATRGLVNLRLELIVRSAAFLEFVRATREGQTLPRQEFELVDGSTKTWIEVSGAAIPSPDGKSRWALFVIHDATRERVLERLRRDFVANASHELRTPLSHIKGYVETLVDGHATMEPADRDRFLRTILRNSERLGKIITDLLTLSRLESDTPGLNFESIELRAFLASFLAEFAEQPVAALHHLELHADEQLGVVQADPEKLTQVLSNLVENATKYSPPESRIEIAARRLSATDEIELSVRDHGVGMPASDLPHIFERFYRVEKGRSRESGGTGLGLSIVKHAVQLHGGRVWAESGMGKGTTIFVRLPRGDTTPVRA